MCFSGELTPKFDIIIMADRWRATIKSDIFIGINRSLADNIKISHKERVWNTMVFTTLALDLQKGSILYKVYQGRGAKNRLNCAKKYNENLLGKNLRRIKYVHLYFNKVIQNTMQKG